MPSIVHLLFEKCKITRTTETRGPDGFPVTTEAVVVDDLPCRLDRGMARTYANTVRGTMRAEQVAGILYIDGAAVDSTGQPLDIKTNDKVVVKGKTTSGDREYEIFDLNRVPGLQASEQWELGVLNVENA